MASASSDTWSLSVKAIGSTLKECTNADLEATAEKNFTVTVSPDDAVTELYDKIETATGLKASQQRLIYRGRLIDSDRLKSDGDVPTKIGDIVGLDDGHTIHLVKRQEPPRDQQRENNASSTSSTSPSTATSSLDRDDAGSGTASLLAALIGLGGLDDGDYTPSTGRQRWRSGRLGRSRRPHYRLTSEDLQIPDPGTLEPVRQGLMTIHTMLPHAQIRDAADMNPSPLAANRRWFRGQWIDVRDTVNAWLEATVVDILAPDDVLPPRENADDDNKHDIPEILEPHTDPAVSAGDLEGRRRLLLEPCDAGDADEEEGELAGFRRRKTNKGVKLLLIHYNGWPHRWDEWIRSDSERIRPFRTRTRHPNMATYSSPTTQSAFNESPPTHIVDDDNSLERPAILPELNRAVTAVNELLAIAAAEESAHLTGEQQENLPWAVRSTPSSAAAEGECNVYDVDDDLDELPPLSGENENPAESSASSQNNSNEQSRLRRRQLQMLAPLLDRLGRTLIDAAPHVAALAQASAENDTEESISTAEAVVEPQQAPEESNPSTLGGLLSLLSRDRRRQSSSNIPDETDAAAATNAQTWPIDPDYVDFATGSVNTTRGEVRSGPRSRSSNDDVAGLLGAYLAAASLGLNTVGGSGGGGSSGGDGDSEENAGGVLGLLRGRGNGGGNGGAGIDIHIHAVVTGPGLPPTTIGGGTGGGLGFAALGGGPPTTPAAVAMRNALSTPSTRERRESSGGSLFRHRAPVSADEDEDMGIFSELYSESPEPVDPNGSPHQLEREESTAPENDFLARLGHSTSASPFTRGTSQRDHAAVSPARLSRNSSDTSSSRRSSTNGSSPRRGSMLGRLFRRSRRSSQG